MNKQHKKQLRNHAIQILFGILIIIPFYNEESWLRYIALGGFVLIMYNLIWFAKNSEEILYYIFPSKSVREKKPKFKDKVWGHIALIMFFIGLIFLVFQMDNLENTIEESMFWKKFGLIGFLFSLLFLVFLFKIRPSIFHESGRRYSVVFGFILGLTTLTISSFSYLNKKYASKEIKEARYTLDRKSTGGKKGNSHWIFVNINESDRRFQLKPELWKKLNVGDILLLKMQRGYLNYDFVTEIKPSAHNAYRK